MSRTTKCHNSVITTHTLLHGSNSKGWYGQNLLLVLSRELKTMRYFIHHNNHLEVLLKSSSSLSGYDVICGNVFQEHEAPACAEYPSGGLLVNNAGPNGCDMDVSLRFVICVLCKTLSGCSTSKQVVSRQWGSRRWAKWARARAIAEVES